MSLLGWVGGFVIANLLARTLSEATAHLIDDATIRYLLSWVGVFVGVLAISSMLSSMIARQLRQPGIDLGNRLLGAVFGVLRGLVIVMVLV